MRKKCVLRHIPESGNPGGVRLRIFVLLGLSRRPITSRGCAQIGTRPGSRRGRCCVCGRPRQREGTMVNSVAIPRGAGKTAEFWPRAHERWAWIEQSGSAGLTQVVDNRGCRSWWPPWDPVRAVAAQCVGEESRDDEGRIGTSIEPPARVARSSRCRVVEPAQPQQHGRRRAGAVSTAWGHCG